MSMGRQVDEDPLTAALRPPPNETPEQKEVRLREEATARKVSDEIDESIRAEKAAMKKKPVKVLLLGQSESGKSTTLKNFQFNYSRKAWAEELVSWRIVIQWNLLRNVHTILDILATEMSEASAGAAPSYAPQQQETSDDDSIAPTPNKRTNREPLHFTEKHKLLKLQLVPLRAVQRDLEERLGASTQEEDETTVHRKPRSHEAFVRSNSGWKSTFLPGRQSSDSHSSRRNREEELRNATEIIASCAEDMKTLWTDPLVQEMLRRRRLKMEEQPGFFLGEVDRVTSRHYSPTDQDVLNARLRTLGVQEHKIHFTSGPANGMDWIIYDVGGSETQRQSWAAYFDDCDAIIFLAPINCFDEKMAENRKKNRLEDSYSLWKQICSNKLLARTQIILFLNKCDLLEKKLVSGVKVKHYVPSFGNRSNDVQTVTQYFAQHFKEICKQSSPQPRQFRVHLTSVVDTTATALTLQVVGENILKSHMERVHLI